MSRDPRKTSREAPLDAAVRTRVVETGDVTMVVDAGAGTGKTTVLLDRLVRLLLDSEMPFSRIAAITFTDKAASQLTTRLRGRLEKAWDERPEKRGRLRTLLREMERSNVSTIHAFCMRLLKEYPIQAGLDPQFEVLDPVQAEAQAERSWEEWLGRALQAEAPELVSALRCGVSLGQVEELKDFLLRERVLLSGPPDPPPTPDPVSCRDVFLVSREPIMTQVLSAGISDRLTQAADIIRSALPDLEAAEPSDLPYVLMRLRIAAYKDLGSKEKWGPGLTPARAAVYPVRQALWDFQERFGNRVLKGLERWLWGYLNAIETGKIKTGSLTYDDLLLKTRDLLKRHPGVRAELNRRFERIFVDEFQDTDPLQAEIVTLLCSPDDRRGPILERGKLFVVGDPKQSIYRFRRADLAQYLSVRDRVKRSPGGAVEDLSVNFRSVPGVLAWVNGRFASLMESQGFPFVPLQAHREAGPPGTAAPVVGLRIETDPDAALNPKDAEARAVAAEVARLLKKPPLIFDEEEGGWMPLKPKHVAVLFRHLANFEEAYEDAFRRLDIPFAVVGGKKFYKRPEITALVSLLSCLSAPAEETLCVAVLRSFLFGFSDEELFLLKSGGRVFRFLEPFEPAGPLEKRLKQAFDLLMRLRRLTTPLGLPEAIRVLFEETDLLVATAVRPHGNQRVANLLKIRDLAASLEDSENSTLRGFAAWLRDRQESESDEEQAPGADEGEGAVRWMTVHQAKGLEFPIVFVAGFKKRSEGSKLVDREKRRAEFAFNGGDLSTAGLEALARTEETESAREDVRLLYVACTRARDSLVVPFPVPMKKDHPLAGLCEGWAEASNETPRDWEAATGGNVRFRTPPAFPEEAADREAFPVIIEGGERSSPGVEAAGKVLDERDRAWKARIEALAVSPAVRTAHQTGEMGEDGEGTAPYAEGDGTGRRFGSLVHRLMEIVLTGDPTHLPAAARLWGAELSLTNDVTREAAELASRASDSDLLKRARAGGRFFCEVWASCLKKDRTLLEGVMDLAFIEDGKWVIVDYKTDRDPGRFRNKYEAQLRAYVELLQTSTGIPVKEAVLYYLRTGEILNIPI